MNVSDEIMTGAQSRCANLPNFLIVGAQKAGTTALRYNLERHPDIYMARRDGVNSAEIHFFDNDANWRKGVEWYQKYFLCPDKLQGEKTPNYLHNTKSHERMASVVPDAKLIVLVRNPVDRAYSHWNHFNQVSDRSKNWGWVVTDFETAFSEELSATRHVHSSILNNGKYIFQLASLFRFYPPEKIHICVTERLRNNTQQEMCRIYRFLGVEEIELPFKNVHVRPYTDPMEKDVRRRLEEYYRIFNEALFKYLGARIHEWD